MAGVRGSNSHDGAAVVAAQRAGAREGPRLELIAATASAEEAAAIVAALERFMRATAAAAGEAPAAGDGWRCAAILEGVGRWEPRDLTDPWINT
jgi:hypothetical protein